MVSLVNSHSNATSRRRHLWEIELIFAPGLLPGWWWGADQLSEVIEEVVVDPHHYFPYLKNPTFVPYLKSPN